MTSLIVGNASDLHVQAVLKSISGAHSDLPVLIDAQSLERGNYSLTDSRLEIEDIHIDLNEVGRGWLRRYAPSNWGSGITSGSLDSALHRSFLTLVGSLSRMGNRTWLTSIDQMLRAEDRMLQLQEAKSLGISIPRTIVASDAKRAIDELGEQFVVKPLTLGYFSTKGGPKAVYTNVVKSQDAMEIDFGAAPFVAQELVEAEHHYRVVTVREKAWVARLTAADRPVDWRQQAQAHHEWEPFEDEKCAQQAIKLSGAFRLGYSSQDWLQMEDRRVFIDLNPGGQWLFLPHSISVDVTQSIARFLCGQT